MGTVYIQQDVERAILRNYDEDLGAVINRLAKTQLKEELGDDVLRRQNESTEEQTD